MDEEKVKMLEESPGVKSSKRVWGSILVGAGGLLLAGVGIVAIMVKVVDPETSLNAGTTLIVVGASLLGVTVLEGIGKALGRKE